MVVGRTLAFVASAARARIAGPELATPVVAGRQIVVSAVEAFAQRRRRGRCFRIGVVRVTIAIGREGQPHNRDRKETIGRASLIERSLRLRCDHASR